MRKKDLTTGLAGLMVCVGLIWFLWPYTAPPLDSEKPQKLIAPPPLKQPVRRFPTKSSCLSAFRELCGGIVEEIPATIIDTGILKHVPYNSFRFGQFECNIYGDHLSPACIEVGFFPLTSEFQAAKLRCQEALIKMLPEPGDQAVLRRLSLEKAMVEQDGLVFEVTPPSDPDAYGGWWITVYDLQKLENSRATPNEMAEVSVSKTVIAKRESSIEGEWTSKDLKNARPEKFEVPLVVVQERTSPPPATGSVYVRGYYRKDGTYVRPHTRRR